MIEWMKGIDPRACVHPGARLGEGVSVGPFSVIGPAVTVGDGTWIGPSVVLEGRVTIGAGNQICQGTSIGMPPQDFRYKDEPTAVVIGDHNIFREGCTIHRGSVHGGGVTRIGSHGYFMVSSHIAHDCAVGDHVLFVNAGTLAGHVEVGDHATIGAFSGVHQFCRIGPHAFIGGYSVVTRDALPFCTAVGNRALCYGINRIGLDRKGFSRETIQALDQSVRTLFKPALRREEAMVEVESRFGQIPEVKLLVEFVRGARRGVVPIRFGEAP